MAPSGYKFFTKPKKYIFFSSHRFRENLPRLFSDYINILPVAAVKSVIGGVAEWSKALVPDPMRSSLGDVGSNPTMAKYIFIFFFSLVSCVRI